MVHVAWLEEPSDGDCAVPAALISGFWREVIPGEPDVPPASLAAEMRHTPRHRTMWLAVALDRDDPVGTAVVANEAIEGRREVAWVQYLVVRPDHRRRGVGG